MRIGFGTDYHRLEDGRELWIGGVKIPHHRGAVGHSDADVLLHAICDAFLGAAALGDIGKHFPDTSEEFRGISSIILLQRTMVLIRDAGYKPVNIDTTLCLQSPKISPYIEKMQEQIAEHTGLPLNAISIKATTTEKLGFIGREEGLVAYASCLLQEIS